MLNQMRHLNSRGLHSPRNSGVYVGTDVTYFYLHNLSGKLVGYQTYRKDADKFCKNPKLAKYFTRISKNEVGVWGLHTTEPSDKVLYVTEGVFDAVALHNLGLPAVAVLSNNPKQLRPWLMSLAQEVVAVCDGDSAGRALMSVCDRAVVMPDGEDAASVNNLEELLCHYTQTK